MERRLREKLTGGKFQDVPVARSRHMSAVRGKGNRTTELRFRFALVRAGVQGWKLHPAGLAGRPDLVFPRERVAIFLDGCFWHGCERCGHRPRHNADFWAAKIRRNRDRDARATSDLRRAGFRVLRLWEHELKDDLAAATGRIVELLKVRAGVRTTSCEAQLTDLD